MERVVLYSEKKDCCGCTACAAICPKMAITMKTDDFGFMFPEIDVNKCIGCRLCQKACSFKNNQIQTRPLQCYVAIAKSQAIRMHSSSGGIFSVLASKFIDSGGIVYGAMLERVRDTFVLRHVLIDQKNDLERIRGSKYLQSNMDGVLNEIRRYLKANRKVLFCGTPCQIDGLKGLLGEESKNLVTIDVLCHGVPSAKLFNDYLNFEKEKLNLQEFTIKFRDKEKNRWTHGAVITKKKNGRSYSTPISYQLSSFYMSFINGLIMRESCYNCKYSSISRPADITLGDYWGIAKEHSELLTNNGGPIDKDLGASCLMVNTEVGAQLVNDCNNELIFAPSTYEKMARKNQALVKSIKKPSYYEQLMTDYAAHGYQAIDRMYKHLYGKQIFASKIKRMIPLRFKRLINKVLER